MAFIDRSASALFHEAVKLGESFPEGRLNRPWFFQKMVQPATPFPGFKMDGRMQILLGLQIDNIRSAATGACRVLDPQLQHSQLGDVELLLHRSLSQLFSGFSVVHPDQHKKVRDRKGEVLRTKLIVQGIKFRLREHFGNLAISSCSAFGNAVFSCQCSHHAWGRMVGICLEKLCTDTVGLLDSLDTLAHSLELRLILFICQQRLILYVGLFWSFFSKGEHVLRSVSPT